MDYILKESLTERALETFFGETLVERALMDCVPQSALSWLLNRSICSLSGRYLPFLWECFGVVKSRTITAPWILRVVVATAG